MQAFFTKEFIKLKQEWDAKLRSEGFDDIERYHSPGYIRKLPYLKRYSTRVRFHYKPEIELYFSKARQFNQIYPDFTPMDKIIWENHCEGVPENKILPILSANGSHISNFCVHYRIARLAKIMLNFLDSVDAAEIEAEEAYKAEESEQLRYLGEEALRLCGLEKGPVRANKA